MNRQPRALVIVLCLVPGAAAADDRDASQLAREARQVLEQYCHKCHGAAFRVPGFDVLKFPDLLRRQDDEGTSYVVPTKPAESLLWQKVGAGEMPPRRQPQPTAAQKETLKQWIAAGAPQPEPEKTKPEPEFLTDEDVLECLRDYLRGVPEDDRRFQRFFTLTVPYNLARLDKEIVRPLPYYRAALSKVINSLSYERDIVLPRAIDRHETLYVVDTRALGWDQESIPDLWTKILKTYPYGIVPKQNDRVYNAYKEIVALAESKMPYVRGDWFVATASRPPLYYTMLKIPESARDLENSLGVKMRDDFERGKAARAGIFKSKIARQNRLLERHRTSFGAYWKSYDFASGGNERALADRPLGPLFDGHPFPKLAFQHDGGEIIFNLPNGLQAYLLVNAKDERLNAAPQELVEDRLQVAGTGAVVAGLSCIGCHDKGIKTEFKDDLAATIRSQHVLDVGGEEDRKFRQLHPTADTFESLLERDRRRFLDAQKEATERFLNELAPNEAGEARVEVVRAVVNDYLNDLSVDALAIELNYLDLKGWRDVLKRFGAGLGVPQAANGAAVPRTNWESHERAAQSLYHKLVGAPTLGPIGIPIEF